MSLNLVTASCSSFDREKKTISDTQSPRYLKQKKISFSIDRSLSLSLFSIANSILVSLLSLTDKLITDTV